MKKLIKILKKANTNTKSSGCSRAQYYYSPYEPKYTNKTRLSKSRWVNPNEPKLECVCVDVI